MTSTQQLCDILVTNAGNAWFVVDEEWLNAGWAYAGPMASTVRGSSTLVAEGANGTDVYHVLPVSKLPVSKWSRFATKECPNVQPGIPR